MTKRTSRRHAPATQAEEVGHLDETLTEVTSTTAATLKKYRYHIVVAVAILSVAIVGVAGFVALRESSLTSYSDKVWHLLQSPAAQKSEPSLEAIDELLADARGSVAERYVIKTVGDYLMSRAIVDKDADEPTSGVSKEDAYTRALALANDTKTRFPEDEDMQSWSGGLAKKLEGEHDTSWIPPSAEYTLPRAPSETKDS